MKRKTFLHLLVRCFAAACVVAAPLCAFAAPAEQALNLSHANVKAVMAVQARVTGALMASPEVLGTAVGVDASGAPALVIYVDQDAPGAAQVANAALGKVSDVAVTVELTEKFRAFARPGGGGTTAPSHKAKQTPPIKLGTSGGWGQDLANGYCCGGTLGSLIQVNGVQYILSNYHVLESDTTPGGNGIVATTGDAVIQPGLIDIGCNAANGQTVATLVKISSLPDSNVDASVAQVVPGMVSNEILQIGTISSLTAAAFINQPVKKSGRTTALTRSKVSGLNATISVTYDNECAGTAAFTKTFTGQVVISNKGSRFLAGGDSGSLMVQDVTTSPKAVGLLYAGSSSLAIANPIDEVLAVVGAALGGTATMVGN